MNRLLLLTLAFLLCLYPGLPGAVSLPDHDEEAVIKLVQDFGRSMKSVPLLAPEDVVAESMRQHYGQYVAPALLEEWILCPLKAPGRAVSSPWPDRIEVIGVKEAAESNYEVEGIIVEMTNTEEAARRPVTLVVVKEGQSWQIRAVLLLPPRQY